MIVIAARTATRIGGFVRTAGKKLEADWIPMVTWPVSGAMIVSKMVDEENKQSDDLWSEEEIDSSVDAWVRLFRIQQDGEIPRGLKIQTIRDLMGLELSKRTKSAIERRFMNISAVSIALNHSKLQGYQPLSHVGTNVWEKIQSRLEFHGLGNNEIESMIDDEMNQLDDMEEDFDLGREKERVWQKIVKREGQNAFKEMLIEAYESRCAVTRVNEPAVLDAAHIRPYNGPQSNIAPNGILLSSNVHRLFDRGLLVITPDYMTMIAPRLRDGQFGDQDGKRILIPKRKADRPMPKLLLEHMDKSMKNW